MNYLRYWGLHDKPFARSEGDYFFSAAPQREAIAGLSYFAASGFAAAFLVSSRRCGATWLMRHVRQMHGLGDCATEVVVTDGVPQNGDNISSSLGRAMGIHPDPGQGIPMESIDVAIEACRAEGVNVVWMIDRLDACTINSAGSVAAAHSNLSIVMAATPDEHRRHAGSLRKSAVQVDLHPLSMDETGDYLLSGLQDAGCLRSLFVDGATVRLHELTGGSIADLSTAAEVSLAIAARFQMEVVTSAIVEAALETQLQAA